MSDGAVLSRQAQRAMDLASALEERVLHERSPDSALAPLLADSWAGQRVQLSELLATVAKMVDPALGMPSPKLVSEIPPALITRLRAESRAGRPRAQPIVDAAAHLRTGGAMGEADLELLGWLAGALEAEASSLYRRMVRH
ncbi:MAG: hypothetical protein M3071_03230 [Actinomycetota bacterium]|nr:hypothetical protein [Actinomycetota bacterium]